jgi:hypothetical protein
MRTIIFLFLLLAGANLLNAEKIQFQSATNRAVLLELYSSEGCSSCPPAETWFSRLKANPRLWKDLVPVGFHVDYWDDLGWRDPFGASSFSDRQRAYSARWQTESVYTPGFVLNGKEWRGWFNRNDLPRASNQQAGVLTISSDDGTRWTVQFVPAVGQRAGAYDYHLALLGFELSSEVKAGENRGRRLDHDFVVLAMRSAAAKMNGDFLSAEIFSTIPSRFTPKRLGIAVWVTRRGELEPVQAVGGWFTPKKS